MKVSEVLAALTDLSYAFPNTKLPTDHNGLEGVARVWHGALGDLEGEHVAMAVSHHIRTEKWFPAPAEIRQAAIRFKAGLPSPANAWLDAQRAAGSRDRAQYENMHNVALQALRDIGGPATINNAVDLTRVREQYMKAYDARVNEVYIAPGLVYCNPGRLTTTVKFGDSGKNRHTLDLETTGISAEQALANADRLNRLIAGEE